MAVEVMAGICVGRLIAPTYSVRQRFYSASVPLFSPNSSSSIRLMSSWVPFISSFSRILESNRSSYLSIVSAFPPDSNGEKEEEEDFVVVNFYRFVRIDDPMGEVSKQLSFLQGRDIHGRIYLNEQGINAQYSGPKVDALHYVEWLKEDDRFSDMLVQISPSDGHAFPRMKLRYKPSLVQQEGGISKLPLVDPTKRATPLAPSEWKSRLQAMNTTYKTSSRDNTSNNQRGLILLDVRNGYEWDIGHFKGARRPNVDSFRTTSFGLSELQMEDSDPLAGIDKEHTDVLMYCTGGIRCDVYSIILREKGFQNLYTLKGGVSHYLSSEGPIGWMGNLFVFDSRLSLPPLAYKSETTISEETENGISDDNKTTFARCHLCGYHVHEIRHRNCANPDCNLLFLSCMSCVEKSRGCCCVDCKTAPRLRPVLPGFQRYEKWHIYRDIGVQNL